MLSGEGNAWEWWKTTLGLISKKATLHVQHTFFVHFFGVVLHDYNMKLPDTSYKLHILWRKCQTCSRSLFFHCCSFSPCIMVAASISRFVTVATRFWCRSSNKKCFLCFLSLALDLCRPFSRQASLAFRLLSIFLCPSLALYSKFVDMTISLSLPVIL